MDNPDYDRILATIADGVVSSEERLPMAVENYEQSLRVLKVERNGALSHAESGVLRTLETLVAESLYAAAMQAHASGDNQGARKFMDTMKRVHEITLNGLK